MSARIVRKLYLLLTLAAPSVVAQAPSFQVASVKPAPPTGAIISPPACPGGRFAARTAVLADIVWAYGIRFFQLDGGPDWTHTPAARFDIQASPASPSTETECRRMLQTLLADRFKLAIHHETKPLDVYALVVAKTGPKIKQATDADVDGVHLNGAKTFGSPKGWSMPDLVDFLQRSFNPAGSPLVDRTGLEGIYKLTLNFAPGPYDFPGIEPRGDGPDIFSALESQLGLRLERRKEPIDIIVIDRLEQPDAN